MLIHVIHAKRQLSDNCTFSEIELLGEECVPTEEPKSNIAINEEYIVSDSVFEICMPESLVDVPEQIIKRKSFAVSYNKVTKQPNWVAWQLTREHSDGSIGRNNSFYEDEEVPLPRATIEDYKRSGWSRGHMCPAGDNKWDAVAMRQTFSLINVCPQDANLNSGVWNSIEIDCRNWAKKFGEIFIVCGPVFYKQDHEVIGSNEVYVPEAFFKVVLCLNGEPKGLGVVVRNTSGIKKKDLCYRSIDEVEEITGIDFFPSLSDDLENRVESEINLELWR